MSRADVWISRLLRGGVVVSAAVVLAGAALFLTRNPGPAPDFHAFHGDRSGYRTVPEILRGARTGGGRDIILLGVLLLIATPVLRVVLSLGLFLRQKDRTYVLVTTLVLSVLMYSLFFAPRT